MTNRNKIIDLFVSNLANSITHQILEKAAFEIQDINKTKYNKEFLGSWQAAKKYREKINPQNRVLPFHDINEIKQKLTNKVKAELNLRISKGYKNIDLNLVEVYIEKALKELRVI